MLVAAVPAGGAVSTLSDDAEFLTTDEVAKRLRVHPTTILRRLGAVDDADPERIPAVRVGRVCRIPRREFAEWLARASQAGCKTCLQPRGMPARAAPTPHEGRQGAESW